MSTRAVIDQAMGVLMGQRHISATDAFDALRSQSQHRNVKLHVIAAEYIETMTNHAPEPAPAFTQRG
jgi:AmiR/NasT family two-component response regulator